MTVTSAVWDIRKAKTILLIISILMDQVMSLYNIYIKIKMSQTNSYADGPSRDSWWVEMGNDMTG